MSRVVIVTGSAGGIGSACVQHFKKDGWQVIGVDLSDKKLQLSDMFLRADVSDEETWKQLYCMIMERYGRLDAVVNNAAIQICKPIVEMTLQEWEQTMAVNLRPAYLSVHYLYPLLKNGGAAIVNVSSVHAVATSKKMAAYATSKGALTALTRALAVELADDGIRVNAVLPGAVDTPMLRAGLERGHLVGNHTNSLLNCLSQKTLMGRVGEPTEIAQWIVLLADSTRSSFITGQCLVIDGGATARLSTE